MTYPQVVTHQLQVERRTVKTHRPKTNALPLSYTQSDSPRAAPGTKSDVYDCIMHCQRCDFYYLRQGGYVIVVVGLSVCLLATLRKNFQTDLHEIFREGWQWANEQTVKFWWRSGSGKAALAKVCAAPVLLVTSLNGVVCFKVGLLISPVIKLILDT